MCKNVFTYSFQWPRPLTWKLFYRFLITRVYHATKFKLSTALQFRGADENMRENDYCILFPLPSDLSLWPFDLKIAQPFNSVRVISLLNMNFLRCFSSESRKGVCQTNRQTDITKTMHLCWWDAFENIRTGSFWSSFDF